MALNACAVPKNRPAQVLKADTLPIAFPGAEGFGKYTTGGRGGRVVRVTNLADAGPGSFREAVSLKVPRIVVFTVSGTIHLETPLTIRGNITIAGQSAPGDGICLADHPVSLGGDNIIVRFLRFRMGDKNQKKGMVDGSGSDDAFGGTRRKNIVVDHCSVSWSTDELMSIYAGDSTSVQWNILSEPLNYSYHFETGDKGFEKHGYGGIWGGRHASFHHNLIAHCNSRTPRFDGIRNAPAENVDLSNNVIYNWGSNNVYAGEGGNYNIVNNYYRYGPSTNEKVRKRIANPYKLDQKIPYGKFFIEGNYADGFPDVTANNWKGVDMEKGTEADAVNAKATTPFPSEELTAQPAAEAYELVLRFAGAIFPKRDTLDQRIINDVKNRSGRFIDVQGGFAHGTAYEKTVNAWPALKSIPAPIDTDQDGMPDDWEKARKLDPTVNDSQGFSLNKKYTNIELYLNQLIKP
ncbi:pectate lyase [Pedobacter sp. HMF7056]|uniref:Pectate lyase n=1 Tax=Hufsiella ginkgonis TaxID=2695274 RepID=A0A7K1XUJ9_9SPHI|nr:pectate lyase [Hufsiella ginkgonis]